jgi:hypothetical protein
MPLNHHQFMNYLCFHCFFFFNPLLPLLYSIVEKANWLIWMHLSAARFFPFFFSFGVTTFKPGILLPGSFLRRMRTTPCSPRSARQWGRRGAARRTPALGLQSESPLLSPNPNGVFSPCEWHRSHGLLLILFPSTYLHDFLTLNAHLKICINFLSFIFIYIYLYSFFL